MSVTFSYDFPTPRLNLASPVSAAVLPDMRADRPWGELVAECLSVAMNTQQVELCLFGEIELARIISSEAGVYVVVLSSDAGGFGSVDAYHCATLQEAIELPVVSRARLCIHGGTSMLGEGLCADEAHRMIELRTGFRFPVETSRWERTLVEDISSPSTLRQRRALRRVREELMFSFSALREVRAN